MSDAKRIAGRAIALLDRADELRAEAREVLDPIDKARGWRGGSDILSSLMTYDLPRKSSLPQTKALRRQKLLGAVAELDRDGASIAVLVNPKKSRSR
jgi:hypothetical protein